MANSAIFSAVGGIGLTIADKNEPDITIVTSLGRSKVYVRRTKDWKEAIAEFIDYKHAEFYVSALLLESI